MQLPRLCAIMLMILSLAGLAPRAGAETRFAALVGIDGAISVAQAEYVGRALRLARAEGAGVVVLRLDTPGGLDVAMREIIRAMLASEVPVIAWVGPAGARAASAGTFILYGAGLAAMAPGTNLGAASPVPLFGSAPPADQERKPGGQQETGRDGARDVLRTKITNDSAAYIRGLASLHGRNAEWAERAVREAVSLPYDAALREKVIDLVAVDLPALLAAADGRAVQAAGETRVLATRDMPVRALDPTLREQLLILLSQPEMIYLLLLAGVFAVAFEVTHPGFVAPGVIGTICLVIGGYGLHLLPVDYAGLALVVLGIALMVAEAFVPAFGAFGLGGAAAFAEAR